MKAETKRGGDAGRMQEEDRASRLEERLEGIESKLQDIARQLEEGGKRSDLSFGMGIGLAGLSAAMALVITSPVWSRGEANLASVAFLLTAVSLAIVYVSLLRFGGDYRKRMSLTGVVMMIVGPVVYMASDMWLDIAWVQISSFLVFALGLALLSLSGRRKGQREVVRK